MNCCRGFGQAVTGLDYSNYMGSGVFGNLLSSSTEGVTAVAPGPTPDQSATMMAGGDAGQAVLDSLNDAQFTAQQTIDASGVVPTLGSDIGGALYETGSAVSSAASSVASYLPWVIGGAAVLALLILMER